MNNNSAFFISPENEIINIPSSHIAYIIDNPEKFGCHLDQIKETYKKYGEPIGSEAQARRDILIDVITRGWIRIRKYRNCWSITVNTLTGNTNAQLKKWGNFIMDNPAAPVKILELETDKGHHLHFQDLYNNKFAESG